MIHSRTSHAKFRRFRFKLFKYDPASALTPAKSSWKLEIAGFATLVFLGFVAISFWRAYSGGVDHIALLDWPVKFICAIVSK